MAQAAASANDYATVERVVSRWAMPPESHPLAPLSHMLLEATQGKRELLDRTVDDAYRAKLWPDLQYAYVMAQIYALVGDTEDAFRWLEQAVGQGWINETLIRQHDRTLDRLRADRRFDALLQRVRAKRTEFSQAVLTG